MIQALKGNPLTGHRWKCAILVLSERDVVEISCVINQRFINIICSNTERQKFWAITTGFHFIWAWCHTIVFTMYLCNAKSKLFYGIGKDISMSCLYNIVSLVSDSLLDHHLNKWRHKIIIGCQVFIKYQMFHHSILWPLRYIYEYMK